jgi:hypothetical protein
MKYTINELANSKGVSQPVREALLQMADYKQLYEQVCEQYDVLAKEFDAIKQALAAPVQEPVAWMFEDDEDNGHKTFIQTPPSPEVVAYLAKWNRPAWVPIYTTPPAQPAPVQEPVAWIEHEWSGSGLRHLHFERREQSVRDEVMNPIWTPLYTTPPAAQPAPVQEPVAWANPNDLKNFDMKVRTNGGPLHTLPLCLCTPPVAQRQWVGLTQEEFRDFATTFEYGTGGLIRAIEAKLKEKNT